MNSERSITRKRKSVTNHSSSLLKNHLMSVEVVSSSMKLQDRISIAILLLLYTLQGIPMGLSGSIPLILKERGASYEALSLFSLVSIPFSLKLLWAPLVDSYYIKGFGRRKTWLVPIQIITGIIMIVGSRFIGGWIGDDQEKSYPSVGDLTTFFFLLYFLMATQDIAVDGWALTMLSRERVGYSSVCNSIGQVLGVFMANQGFIALSDAKWCHSYLGVNGGALINLADFTQFWGYVFILTTICIWLFKAEEVVDDSDHPDGLLATCKQIVSIFKLPSIQSFALILLTCRIGFAASDAVFTFKLQEYGMPKADIATISPLLMVISLMLPAITSSSVSARPLDMLLLALPVRIAVSVGLWTIAQYTSTAYAAVLDGTASSPPMIFLASLIVLLIINEIAGTLMFISLMSFFSRISDPTIGGSYMTLLNTLCNLGAKWPASLSLWLMPKMTLSLCQSAAYSDAIVGMTREILPFPCVSDSSSNSDMINAVCTEHGGICSLQIDGYTLQVAIGFVLGILWLFLFYNKIQNLQALPHADWLITVNSGNNDNSNNKGR